MKVFIERENEKVHFYAYANDRGHSVSIDGKEEIGGENKGLRPGALMLMSIGSCAVMDFASLIYKQKIAIEDLIVEVSGEREQRGSTAPFVSMHIRFVVLGVSEDTVPVLQQFAKASVEQLCSMKASLHPDIRVSYELVKQK